VAVDGEQSGLVSAVYCAYGQKMSRKICTSSKKPVLERRSFGCRRTERWVPRLLPVLSCCWWVWPAYQRDYGLNCTVYRVVPPISV